MHMSKNQTKMIPQEARYGVQLDYVIFPIDFRDIRRVLAKNGYELSPVERLPPPPARISFSGEVARKAEMGVVVDSGSGEIGVVGMSLQQVKDLFEELARVINSELNISLYENVGYYWCHVHYKVDTGRTPLNEIAKVENKDYIARFSQILREDLTSFSVRLAPKNAIINQQSWFDIAIEPDILNEKLYHVGVVFRNPNRNKTETFVRNLENNLLKLIEVVEGSKT